MSEEDLRFSERYQERLKWDEDTYKSIQGIIIPKIKFQLQIMKALVLQPGV